MLQELRINTNQRTEFVDITSQVRRAIFDVKADGILVVYVPHTTAGLTLNENADPSVVADITNSLEQLVPWKAGYRHTEGNAAAHIKSSLFGHSLQLLVENGELVLGTWQGIFFCEFDGPRNRRVLLKFIQS